MTPYYADDWMTVYAGDCREVLASMPAESVHCVVTSPPYWGLRDYGTATWEGGDEGCDHVPSREPRTDRPAGGLTGSKSYVAAQEPAFRDTCRKCGARRIDAQLGLEATPEEYVANMVAVFRAVRRVLRDDGTVWLNLGDSFASHDPGGYREGEFLNPGGRPPVKGQARNKAGTYRPEGYKRKDLLGVPWRVAFALQADGWYLRSDIIWAKPNPMPESVTDRPTKAHEYLFLLTKSPRYFFDSDAVREPDSGQDHPRRVLTGPSLEPSGGLAGPHTGIRTPDGRNGSGRNLRSVWTIATEPYPGAHFATFPRKLVEPCVKAGTSEKGVCPECGAPWVRVVEREPFELGRERERNAGGRTDGFSRPPGGAVEWAQRVESKTIGWRPTCRHFVEDFDDTDPRIGNAQTVPATVLDPFAGSGTTLLVAQSLGRRAIGIDLNPEYLEQALRRNAQPPLGLAG